MNWLSPIREIFDFVFPFLERFLIVRIILGCLLVFFLPGFAWTLVFFKQIRVIERIVLSVALSIVVVTISLLFFNRLIGVRIAGFGSVLIIIATIVLPVAVYYCNKFIGRRRDSAA